MKYALYLSILLFGTVSCYKKSRYLENMNQRIIDYDYAGDKWFEHYSTEVIEPDVGEPFLRIQFLVKDEYHENFDCHVQIITPYGDTITGAYSRLIRQDTYDFSIGTPRTYTIGIKDKYSPNVINPFSETVIYEG